MHHKSLDTDNFIPIIRTMMQCNIAPANWGERYKTDI
jgi:hypothetical protein